MLRAEPPVSWDVEEVQGELGGRVKSPLIVLYSCSGTKLSWSELRVVCGGCRPPEERTEGLSGVLGRSRQCGVPEVDGVCASPPSPPYSAR